MVLCRPDGLLGLNADCAPSYPFRGNFPWHFSVVATNNARILNNLEALFLAGNPSI